MDSAFLFSEIVGTIIYIYLFIILYISLVRSTKPNAHVNIGNGQTSICVLCDKKVNITK